MLIDPMIHHGAPKQVRYDGSIVPGNPHAIPPTPSDPRKKLPSALWRRLEAMELPVPRFVVSECHESTLISYFQTKINYRVTVWINILF